ncbi:DUF6868 family protein [Nitrosomonas supralitoralis]|uniref:DUF6868 domain-containing protein n=1 Tax=Nitrosomonas supralitoralis TaxID=2116706 RepID=A0A2P7NR63_9PROT|nr:hypothetical protein C7H79_16140 [Nitrosomonas supralitoralis]
MIFAAIALVFMRGGISRIHGKMFKRSEDLSSAYFLYLAQYKIAIFIFNLVPYVVLKLAT